MKHITPDQVEQWTQEYLNGTISNEDRESLEAWYRSLPDEELVWDDPKVSSAEMLKRSIYSAIEGHLKGKNRSVRRLYSIRVAAAVLLTLLAGWGIWFSERREIAEKEVGVVQDNRDVSPGITQAVLTLADGTRIVLDTVPNGKLAEQGATAVFHKDGMIVYEGGSDHMIAYNSITTGRGEQSPPLVLADGSKIWLNAASSLRFPVTFSGSKREIEITGEAFLEVSHYPGKPFIVHTGNNTVEVLGTRFNVMSYDDEPTTIVTLLDGAVLLKSESDTRQLAPGQEGRIRVGQKRIAVNEVNTNIAVAWRQGQIPLQRMDLSAFLRQVSRWYDVDVVYEGTVPAVRFSGFINREVSLKVLLEALRENGVMCRLAEGKLIVSSKE